ncbi:MAG: hypothetical protein H0X23_12480 [Rubrobacter sp.]|nr:hypothetical protein [Rubrobacter sp.]
MILDISQPLRMGVPVWPGDTEYAFDLAWSRERGSSVNVGRITMSAHPLEKSVAILQTQAYIA